jgi:GNAT superfamily N-acetyltransferase
VLAGPPGSSVREAHPEEFERLLAVEREADTIFRSVGIGPFADDGNDAYLADASVVFAVGDPAVGFASVGIVDGYAHLWQLAVVPELGGHGHGTALVRAVCDWTRSQGLGGVTLTTFRDVAWNAPFYTKLGFRPIAELTTGLAAIRDHEQSIGDDAFGPRLAMRWDS